MQSFFCNCNLIVNFYPPNVRRLVDKKGFIVIVNERVKNKRDQKKLWSMHSIVRNLNPHY